MCISVRVCGNTGYEPGYLFFCDISLARTLEEGTEGMLIAVRQWSDASFASLFFISRAQNSMRLPSCAW